ncbi:poly-gamma-glutamate hydrolase family protein [Natrialba sp. SSL1]|uniref:poly-gamma-glutamate hydrolase family protein n=1 Tax=Natrialba sp. SSL1 TaxID=1869245 RepID=UPI0008F80B45|nr:poly-gamma-glutamate hydrolase family protein [Natrialba sp. SSL1]OIB57769.1 hypothetical protein BBD46_13400 [Natrialba sp. SSL1]
MTDDTNETGRIDTPKLTRRSALTAAVGTPALLGLAVGSYEAATRVSDGDEFETGILCPLADNQPSLEGEKTAISADPRLLSAHGLSAGQQVRLVRNDNDDEFAIYTIVEERPENPSDIIRGGTAARKRLDLASVEPTDPGNDDCPELLQAYTGDDEEIDVTVSTTIPNPDLSEDEAREQGELIERLDDRGSDLLFLAPHGGAVQPKTDQQAEHAGELAEATCWRTKGWGPNGVNAFHRWHVPTSELSPSSYPELETIADEEFELAVDFSGVCETGIVVGGTADRARREAVRDSINDALPTCSVTATLADDESGTNQELLSNRLAAETIYLAQSYDARRAYWEEISLGVAAGLSDDVVLMQRHSC